MDTTLLGEIISLVMFAVVCGVLLLGFPVAFTLAGVAVAFASFGSLLDLFGVTQNLFSFSIFGALPSRYLGVMQNELLVAVPLFVFMGVMLERSKIAEQLLTTMGLLFGSLRGGMGLSVIFVGMLLAASTGIVGATVVTMGLLSLPAMMNAGYDNRLACGAICASGTLGQIIPPSIVLILLGDYLSSAYTQAQLDQGNFAPQSVSVVDLFAGAFIPGMVLVVLYMAWVAFVAFMKPKAAPAIEMPESVKGHLGREVLTVLVPPATLIIVVLGSILGGLATPTESAAIGAVGATLMALARRRVNWAILREVVQQTTLISCMVFIILLGASVFSLVFRGYGGEHLVEEILSALPGGIIGAVVVVMALMFVMGFFLDFIEIIFVVVPIVGPVLLKMGLDPIWLGIMIAVNLQTSFLTPPFGFALFYLRGVAPESISTTDIYRGVAPFVVIQIGMLGILALFPALATWLPGVLGH